MLKLHDLEDGSVDLEQHVRRFVTIQTKVDRPSLVTLPDAVIDRLNEGERWHIDQGTHFVRLEDSLGRA